MLQIDSTKMYNNIKRGFIVNDREDIEAFLADVKPKLWPVIGPLLNGKKI